MNAIESYLAKATPIQREMYSILEKEIRNFSSFPIIGNDTCISCKGRGKKNICALAFENQSNITIFTTLLPSDFVDPKNLVKKHNAYGRFSRFVFKQKSELKDILDLIKQSYEKNKY